MHHIHQLKKLDPSLAGRALDELITLRLSRDAKEEWVERAFMLRIWITTVVENSALDCEALQKLLDDMFEMTAKPLSAAAAHAAQTVSILRSVTEVLLTASS